MKLGLLLTSLTDVNYIERCLAPWLEFKKEGQNEVLISAVSVFFKEYERLPEEKTTRPFLRAALERGDIDYLVDKPDGLLEHEARNLALEYLLKNDIELLYILDSDEIYSVENIKNILKFVDNQPFCAWFSVCFKNIIFDGKTHLIEPFSPPRIFRAKLGIKKLYKFFWDNDLYYYNRGDFFENTDYRLMSNMKIPQSIGWIPHWTWLNDGRGRAKHFYQMSHFGHCGYSWNEKENCLEFNLDYYKKHNLPLPEIETEDE